MWGNLREDQLLNRTVVSEAGVFAVVLLPSGEATWGHVRKEDGEGLPQRPRPTAPPALSIRDEWVLPSPASASSLAHKHLSCHLWPRPCTSTPLAPRPPDVSLGPSKVSSRSSCSKGICCMRRWLKTTENYRHISDGSKSDVQVSAGPCSV